MKTMIDCTLYQWKRAHKNSSILFGVLSALFCFQSKMKVLFSAIQNSVQFTTAGFSA